jgi:DNA repair exonuclease SbcCD nuclease subunit
MLMFGGDMRIAFTADLHLTSRAQNPERFETLENLLADMREKGIETLVIAGDLFDASRQNYAEFEQVCREPDNQDITIAVIPGNHDPGIDNQKLVASNLKVVSEPWIRELGGRTFLFLPYRDGKTMGEEIELLARQLPAGEWVLVAHGDWAGGLRTPNPIEPGVYMPLTRRDIEVYQPARVFLGHIHVAMDAPPVHYVGSPCGLDITETGRRRCLLYDTETNQVEPMPITAPVLYFNETFVMVPVKDEARYLETRIDSRLKRWDLQPEEKGKAVIRVNVAGYSADRAALRSVLQEAFEGFKFYKGEGPNIDQVSISDDFERHHIAEQVRANVETLEWPEEMDEPSADEILLEALHIIYGK